MVNRPALEPKDRLIVALDRLCPNRARRLITELAPYVGMFKVGKEAITDGRAHMYVDFARQVGVSTFYDGKFHDIPDTVRDAVRAAARVNQVTMINVHVLGGRRMMHAAAGAANHQNSPPFILGVTVLTSMEYKELREVGLVEWARPEDEQARLLDLISCQARLAKESGLHGVVAPAFAAFRIHKECGNDFLVVSPGIRSKGDPHDDQKHVMTAGEAIRNGVDYVVVGRSITAPKSGTSVDAAKRIVDEIASAS